MNLSIFFIFTILVLTNCANQSNNMQVNEKATNDLEQKIATPTIQIDTPISIETNTENTPLESSIKNTKGLIVLSDNYGKNDFIRFYNDDGSLWYEFTYYYDDKDGEFEYANENFAPFAFYPDYSLLALKCVSGDKSRYEVIVNEETGVKKFVRKDASILKFETWGKHILRTFSVAFDENVNPLRENPEGKLKEVKQSTIDRFTAVEVKGDWLKVKWDTEDNPNNDLKKSDFGWIKWKADERLLIELFYFA